MGRNLPVPNGSVLWKDSRGRVWVMRNDPSLDTKYHVFSVHSSHANLCVSMVKTSNKPHVVWFPNCVTLFRLTPLLSNLQIVEEVGRWKDMHLSCIHPLAPLLKSSKYIKNFIIGNSLIYNSNPYGYQLLPAERQNTAAVYGSLYSVNVESSEWPQLQ